MRCVFVLVLRTRTILPAGSAVRQEIGTIAKATDLSNRLRHTKIGTVDGRVKKMTEIACDEFELKDKLSVRIVNLDKGELTDAPSEISPAVAVRHQQNLKTGTQRITTSDECGIEFLGNPPESPFCQKYAEYRQTDCH